MELKSNKGWYMKGWTMIFNLNTKNSISRLAKNSLRKEMELVKHAIV